MPRLRVQFDSLSLVMLALFDLTLHLFGFLACRSDEFALQIVDVAFAVEKVLLLVALDLNPAQALLGQVLRVVHVDHVIVFVIFAVHGNHATVTAIDAFDKFLLTVVLQLLLLLKGQQLALCQVFVIDITVGVLPSGTILFSIVINSLLMKFVMQVSASRIHHCQLIDLIHDKGVLTWRRR